MLEHTLSRFCLDSSTRQKISIHYLSTSLKKNKKKNRTGYTMGLSFKLLNRITVCLWQSMPVALHLCTPSVTRAFTSALLYS